MNTPHDRSGGPRGREAELTTLRGFVDRARVSGGSLVVTGEPGIGKSMLLEAAAAMAEAAGTTVLRLVAAQHTTPTDGSGLPESLRALAAFADGLDTPQAEALRSLAGRDPGSGDLLLSNTVTLLLREAAEARPLLVLVDGLPRGDTAGGRVLSFVARRLSGSRAGLLASLPTTSAPGVFDASGLPDLPLAPLDASSAWHLLDDRFPDLHPSIRHQILRTAQGNPLAILHLPAALTEGQRQAIEPLPAVLPLSPTLHRLLTPELAALPARTRLLLLTAALEGTGDLRMLSAAAGPDHSLDELAPAEQQQLISVDGVTRRLAFRHPLVRAAAVAVAPPEARARAHLALAAAITDSPERNARHLAEAVHAPDEATAALIESAARHARARGDLTAGIALLLHAAALSPDPPSHDRRLAEAAYLTADSSSAGPAAAAMLKQNRQAAPRRTAPLHHAATAALIMLEDGEPVQSAHHLVLTALTESRDEGDARSHEGRSDHELHDALRVLLLTCFLGGDQDMWGALEAELERLTQPAALLRLATDLLATPVVAGASALPHLSEALNAAQREVDPIRVQYTAWSALYADRLAEVREPLWRAIIEGRAGGPVRHHLAALMLVGMDDFHRGEWGEQAELAAEGLRICDFSGNGTTAWCFQYHQALLAAVQGRPETAWNLAHQMLTQARRRGAAGVHGFARHALVLSALGQGDWEGAFRHAEAVSAAGHLAPHAPHALWVALDLVDAAVRTGRHDAAAAHARAMHTADVAALSPRLAIHAAAAQALVAPDEAAPALFERALGLPTVEEWPFDAARIRLLSGERLRHTRATNESRMQLTQALATFQELGAAPWAERAQRELRAAGRAAPPREADSLTAQERQIADLAAQGLTNKEIAERLALSSRTIGTHLYRIFPKLGVTKRAALRDALDTARRPGQGGSLGN
ncbi:LuxR C-terminal-related transcriptional regulator [Streptomyces mirabilis]|uniref:helix-turn-helix transcriptional regulator n=1 Tax=Streptomyces mirabilis TaxID=68239 RepID=UPI0036878298